jgi:hypothetical protein
MDGTSRLSDPDLDAHRRDAARRSQQRGDRVSVDGRGRYYIPGFASNAVGAGGVIAAACVTAINNWAGNVANSGLSAIIGPQVLGLPARAAYTSPITGRNFPARNAQTVALTGVQMKDNHWDSQRRRGLK